MKNPEAQDELLERYKNFDKSYLSSLKDHFKQMKKIVCSVKFLCLKVVFVAVGMTAMETFQCKCYF